MFRKSFLILLFAVVSLWAMNPFALQTGYRNLKLSPNGRWLIYDRFDSPGLYLLNRSTNQALKIASGEGIALFAQWSPDSRYVGFKLFKQEGSKTWQIPCLFDVTDSAIIPLHDPVSLAGVPSVDAEHNVVFTIGKTLFLTDTTGTVRSSYSLPDYANLTPVSSDGQRVVFNDANDQLYFLDLSSGQQFPITYDNGNYFNPQWNPTQSVLAFQSFDGQIFVFDASAQREIWHAKGLAPLWSADGRRLLFVRKQIVETQSVLNSDVFAFDRAKASVVRLSDTPDIIEDFPTLSPDGMLFFEQHTPKEQGLFKRSVFNAAGKVADFNAQAVPIQITHVTPVEQPEFGHFPGQLTKTGAYHFDIPYVHQCYDSPTWFNGCTACGGTAATMCIAYYKILPKRPRTVYDPFRHVTDYGDYIAEIYTYNGFTFDIWAYDRNGVKGYGAFGFIVRHGSEAWSDTKGFMAEYARKHGLYSYVDWGPTRTKLMNEADAKRPFVLLNSITSAGHYISVIGYDKNATTVIVNDPAGDKSLGHYGANYEGKAVSYDWPGYSNGHPNLNTVWCFIYFRDRCADLATNLLSAPDTLLLGRAFRMQGFVTNTGNNVSDSTKLLIFLSQNQSYEPTLDWVIDTLAVPAIAPKDTFYFETQCQSNDSLVSINFYLGVHIQTVDRANEAYLKNNTKTKKVAVKGYPIIYRVLPRGEITENSPEIKGYFADRFSPIDQQHIRMSLDSTDVSDSLAVSNTSVIFKPQQKLSTGVHHVDLWVANTLGFESHKKWEFTVASETGIEDALSSVPKHLQLGACYPNPFNNQTRTDFLTPAAGFVRADLFNIQGQKVKTVLNTNLPAGRHHLIIDAGQLASGIYLLRLQARNEIRVRRLLLIK